MDTNAFIQQVTKLNMSGRDDDSPLEGVPGWDSLAMVNLVVGLENRIGRMLDQDEMENIRVVGDVRKLLD